MLNHSSCAHVTSAHFASTHELSEGGSESVYSTKIANGDVLLYFMLPCQPGEEVCLLYSGELSNADLLLSYGFTEQFNESEYAVVELDDGTGVPERHFLTLSKSLPALPPALLQAVATALGTANAVEVRDALKDMLGAQVMPDPEHLSYSLSTNSSPKVQETIQDNCQSSTCSVESVNLRNIATYLASQQAILKRAIHALDA
jgi:hypothetical protein